MLQGPPPRPLPRIVLTERRSGLSRLALISRRRAHESAALIEARKKRRVAVDASMMIVIILLMTQMWLLTATLESYLAGHHDVALPGMLTSAALFLACFAIYRVVVRLDRAPETEKEVHGLGPWDIR